MIMLRTNTNAAKQNIRAYIVNNFDGCNYGYETPATFKECAALILATFENEYMKGYNARRNRQECFVDWCAGLPSILDTCYFYNRSAVDDLGAILEETDAEKARFSESDAEQMLTKLIYREICAATR